MWYLIVSIPDLCTLTYFDNNCIRCKEADCEIDDVECCSDCYWNTASDESDSDESVICMEDNGENHIEIRHN